MTVFQLFKVESFKRYSDFYIEQYLYMRFSSDIAASDFDITDADGNVVAKAYVTPGTGKSGGKVHVTFTNAVENKCKHQRHHKRGSEI